MVALSAAISQSSGETIPTQTVFANLCRRFSPSARQNSRSSKRSSKTGILGQSIFREHTIWKSSRNYIGATNARAEASSPWGKRSTSRACDFQCIFLLGAPAKWLLRNNCLSDAPLPHTDHDWGARCRAEHRWIGGCTRSKRSKRPPEMIFPGALSFWPPLRYKSYLAVKPREFGYPTIAIVAVCVHLFLSYFLAEALMFAISASAITDANSAIE